jgi:hypothetical protein
VGAGALTTTSSGIALSTRLQLIEGQELKIEVHVSPTPATRTRGATNRVLTHPTAIDCVLDNRVQKAQHVADRLRREIGCEHPRRQRLHMIGREVIDLQPTDTR